MYYPKDNFKLETVDRASYEDEDSEKNVKKKNNVWCSKFSHGI